MTITEQDLLLLRLTAIEEKLDRINGLLTEFEPVLRAYVGDAASGPVAWAVRRNLGKKAK